MMTEMAESAAFPMRKCWPIKTVRCSVYISAVYVSTVAEQSRIHRLLERPFSDLSLKVSRIRFQSTGPSSTFPAVGLIHRSSTIAEHICLALRPRCHVGSMQISIVSSQRKRELAHTWQLSNVGFSRSSRAGAYPR